MSKGSHLSNILVLQEDLINHAADTKDHTVSDTFVQLMRSRKAGAINRSSYFV